jgi:hypothetical protein
MKTLRKLGSPFLSIGLILLFLFPMKAEARFIGSDCETYTTGGGESCYVTRTVCSKYFFWIRYNTTITIDDIDCSHLE